MSRNSLRKLVLRAARQSTPRAGIRSSTILRPISRSILNCPRLSYQSLGSEISPRAFSTTRPQAKGLSPESEDPPAKDSSTETTEYNVGGVPAELSNEQYNALADEYLNSLIEKLEELQEETEDVDCEYSAGVLTLGFQPNGTYVINKQPPNKQIWLSSPISGPKRYDYVIRSEGQDAKEGTGDGEWVYLRDGSTLSELLRKEVGVDMSEPYAPVPHIGE